MNEGIKKLFLGFLVAFASSHLSLAAEKAEKTDIEKVNLAIQSSAVQKAILEELNIKGHGSAATIQRVTHVEKSEGAAGSTQCVYSKTGNEVLYLITDNK